MEIELSFFNDTSETKFDEKYFCRIAETVFNHLNLLLYFLWRAVLSRRPRLDIYYLSVSQKAVAAFTVLKV